MAEDILFLGLTERHTGPTRGRSGPRSRTITTSAGSPISRLGTSDRALAQNWAEMPNFHDAKSLHLWWDRQQKNRQSEAEESAPGTDTIEPPFPLEVLSILALENPEFFAIVDQIATDVAGLGYMVADKKEVPQAELDVVEPAAGGQRIEAEEFLKSAPRDSKTRPMTLTQLFKAVVIDKKTTGNGYVEVSSKKQATQVEGEPIPASFDEVIPEGMFHVPSRNVRRLSSVSGGGWKQISDNGQNIAVFREWGSDPNAPSSRVTATEAAKYKNATEGELKNELRAFWSYQSADVHYGIPPVIAALRSVFGTIYAENRNLRFFINRGLPDWIIEIKADDIDLQEGSEARTMIDDLVTSIEMHMKYLLEGEDHRALLTEIPRDRVEVKWERLGDAVKDQDFPTYRVPPSRLGIIEAANLGSGSGQNQAETYKTSIIDPEQTETAEFVNEVLARRGFALVEFKWNEMDVTDELRQAQILQIVGPYLSVNEGRAFVAAFLPSLELKPYDDDDLADIPQKLLELQTGAGAPQSFGGGFGLSADVPQLPPGLTARRFLPTPFQTDPTYGNVARRLAEWRPAEEPAGRADGGTR